MNGTLETLAYKESVAEINKVMEFSINYDPAMDRQLGPIHERALDSFEAGQMRDEEFMDIRRRLRSIGMSELWY